MSDETPKRNALGHYLPGFVHKHKPPGRPKGYKGIAKEIQKRTQDGKTLLDFLFSVLDGTVTGGATLAAKMWATEQLLNRGYGKAPQVVEISSTLDTDAHATTIDMSKMTEEELEAMEKAAEIASRYAGKRKPIDV